MTTRKARLARESVRAKVDTDDLVCILDLLRERDLKLRRPAATAMWQMTTTAGLEAKLQELAQHLTNAPAVTPASESAAKANRRV